MYEENLLPEFPLAQPAEFQIFESDCKINPSLIEQLRYRFFENENTNADEFITENLNKMLTRTAASVFSWTGTQGNIPLVKFRCMKALIGSFERQIPQTIKFLIGNLFISQIVLVQCVVSQQRTPSPSFAIGF